MDEFEFPPDQTYESMLTLQYQAKYLKIIRVPNKDMHKSLQEFDFCHIQTADIVELIGPEKTIAVLLENYSKYFNDFTWWLSGERSLPFGLLVCQTLRYMCTNSEGSGESPSPSLIAYVISTIISWAGSFICHTSVWNRCRSSSYTHCHLSNHRTFSVL